MREALPQCTAEPRGKQLSNGGGRGCLRGFCAATSFCGELKDRLAAGGTAWIYPLLMGCRLISTRQPTGGYSLLGHWEKMGGTPSISETGRSSTQEGEMITMIELRLKVVWKLQLRECSLKIHEPWSRVGPTAAAAAAARQPGCGRHAPAPGLLLRGRLWRPQLQA